MICVCYARVGVQGDFIIDGFVDIHVGNLLILLALTLILTIYGFQFCNIAIDVDEEVVWECLIFCRSYLAALTIYGF